MNDLSVGDWLIITVEFQEDNAKYNSGTQYYWPLGREARVMRIDDNHVTIERNRTIVNVPLSLAMNMREAFEAMRRAGS